MTRQHAIRFPDELHERITALAAEQDRSFAYVVVKTLEKALDGLGSDQPTGGKSTEGPAISAPLPARPAPPRASEPLDRAAMFRQATERKR